MAKLVRTDRWKHGLKVLDFAEKRNRLMAEGKIEEVGKLAHPNDAGPTATAEPVPANTGQPVQPVFKGHPKDTKEGIARYEQAQQMLPLLDGLRKLLAILDALYAWQVSP